VSWSLLTIHTTLAIALQLMRGSSNSQQRPWTSKKDTKFHNVCVRVLVSEDSNNLVRITKSGSEVLLKFLQGARDPGHQRKTQNFITYVSGF